MVHKRESSEALEEQRSLKKFKLDQTIESIKIDMFWYLYLALLIIGIVLNGKIGGVLMYMVYYGWKMNQPFIWMV